MITDDEASRAGEATAEFEAALTDLVLQTFARGGKIEGMWWVETPVADAPNWRVTVSKIASDDPDGYDPTFIER